MVLIIQLNIELLPREEDGINPLEVAILEDMEAVAEIELESEGDVVAGDVVADPPPPFSDPVELPGEEVETSDDGVVGLGVEEIERSVVVDGRVVDPPVANSFATARLIQKHARRMARAFKLIEHIMVVARCLEFCAMAGQCEIKRERNVSGGQMADNAVLAGDPTTKPIVNRKQTVGNASSSKDVAFDG
jgi:hypothetical protein